MRKPFKVSAAVILLSLNHMHSNDKCRSCGSCYNMKYIYGFIIPLLTIIGQSLTGIHESTPSFKEIGTSLGYPVNEYDIVTQDGYILKLFNIPGNRSKPVLLMHGIIDSADTFIIRGNSSLAIVLANSGYDVWVGNNRGNRYARRHIYLDPDADKEFWDFSFHESGYYDLPAIIDFILDITGSNTLSAVGHSQGNTIFLVLGATRPEYNNKVNVLISLSPICFLNNLKNAVYALMNSIPTVSQLYKIIGEEEFLGDDTLIVRVFRIICGPQKSYTFCTYGILFAIAGRDSEEFEPEFYPTVIAHYPTGTSIKNARHVAQVGLRRSFAEYDYGCRNVDIYNSSIPPVYDLSKVTMKVALLAGRNDEISTLKDVQLLRDKLPNVVENVIINHRKLNHLDPVWGKNMNVYLFPTVFDILSKYS